MFELSSEKRKLLFFKVSKSILLKLLVMKIHGSNNFLFFLIHESFTVYIFFSISYYNICKFLLLIIIQVKSGAIPSVSAPTTSIKLIRCLMCFVYFPVFEYFPDNRKIVIILVNSYGTSKTKFSTLFGAKLTWNLVIVFQTVGCLARFQLYLYKLVFAFQYDLALE